MIAICLFMFNACNPRSASQTPDLFKDEIQTSYPSNEKNNLEKDFSKIYPPPISTLTDINSIKVDDPILTDSTKGSISGLIINYFQQRPLTDTDIYLTKGIGPNGSTMPSILAGSLTSRGDISGKTSDEGIFTFTDIDPGNYFLIVSMDLSPIFSSINDSAPLLISVEAGNKNNLGSVYYTGK